MQEDQIPALKEERLISQFPFFKETNSPIVGLSLNIQQAKEIAEVIIDGVMALPQFETPEEILSVNCLFTPQATEKIKNGEISYNSMLNKLQKSYISQGSKSRIYHKIANIKRHPQINLKYQNEYGVQCIKVNDYKELSEAELEEIVHYETIAEQITQMGQRIKQKIDIIRRQSQKIVKNHGISSLSFYAILQEVIKERKVDLAKIDILFNPPLIDLAIIAFKISLGIWDQQIGKVIDKALKKQQLSVKLKSAILSIFFHKFHLPREAQFNIKTDHIFQNQISNEACIDGFFSYYFCIQQSFQYITQNYRLYHRAQQLKQIFAYQQSFYFINKRIQFVDDLVVEEHCFQKIKNLQELFNLYSIFNKENSYFEWIQNQITQIPQNTNTEKLRNQVYVVKAEKLIVKNEVQQAVAYLQYILNSSKDRKDHHTQLNCEILLAECHIKINNANVEQLIDYYEKKVIKKAEHLRLELRGTLYADSLWRIEEYLWQRYQTNAEKCQILKSFTTRALQQMSRSKGEDFIYAMKKRYLYFEKYKINRSFQIHENKRIKSLKMRDIGAEECLFLSQAGWRNIKTFNLDFNNIGEQGCLYLTRAKWDSIVTLKDFANIGSKGCLLLSMAEWKNITNLNLGSNNIGAEGCLYLSQGGWKDMKKLDLSNNNIGYQGCQYLSTTDWKNMFQLNLQYNNIGAEGCRHLSLTNWKNISILNLRENNIGSQGCLHLSHADWKNITILNLYFNKIETEGCKHLSSATWKDISILNLDNNTVGAEGCLHLSQAGWNNITEISLDFNNIGIEGCQHLSNSNWQNISTLNLYSNNIGAKGCLFLSKAGWKNMSKLNLGNNKIGAEGCLHLSKAQWKDICELSLGSGMIELQGYRYLSKANWMSLKLINLTNNARGTAEYVKGLFIQQDIQIYI